MLDTPFFIILILLIHSRLGHCKLWICSHLYQMVDGLDQNILVPDVVLKCHQNSLVTLMHLSIFVVVSSEVVVDTFCELFDKIDQKLEPIHVHLSHFIS